MQGPLIGGFSGFLARPNAHATRHLVNSERWHTVNTGVTNGQPHFQLTETHANARYKADDLSEHEKENKLSCCPLEASACSPDFPIAPPPNPPPWTALSTRRPS